MYSYGGEVIHAFELDDFGNVNGASKSDAACCYAVRHDDFYVRRRVAMHKLDCATQTEVAGNTNKFR